jgi:hypothetical protein
VAERLQSLERSRNDLTENLRDYNNRQLEANVQSNLERKQLGEQFRILEPAFAAREPSSPNRVLIILVGLLMGFGLGGGAAVVAEATDSSLHTARDLQTALAIPVLAAIPQIILEPERRAQRRRRGLAFMAAVIVVVVCLLGGAITYRVVNGQPGAPEDANDASGAARLDVSQSRVG